MNALELYKCNVYTQKFLGRKIPFWDTEYG